MKKLIGLVVVLALVIWVVSWFRVPKVVETSAARPWPAGLGTLESAAARYTALEASAAAVTLVARMKAVPKSEAIDAYVARELSRGEIAIGEPPAVPDVAAIREALLRERIVWKRDAGLVEVGEAETQDLRGAQMTAARALVATALSKGRQGDASAWDDLRAVWNLSKTLQGQQAVMLHTAALSMGRMVNAAAWKMPLPAPAWAAELQQYDYVRQLLAAFQAQGAAYWQDGAGMFPTKWLADSIERDRQIAARLAATTQCDVTAPMNALGTDLSTVWRRAFRYRAEREATANALRLRAGQPLDGRSACSDGTWAFDETTLRFSRDIVLLPPDRPMPLVLRIER